MHLMTTRREFLRAGLLGGVVPGAMRMLPVHAAASAAQTLTPEQREVLAAIAPVLLAGALPEGERRAAAVAAVVDGVERAVAGLPPHLRAELDQLFMLLTFGPTRWLVAGVGAPWSRATTAQIAGFLDAWRTSWLVLLQSGYHALHELIMAAWYARPESWPALRYPGPPTLS
jgi:hypothetical protein